MSIQEAVTGDMCFFPRVRRNFSHKFDRRRNPQPKLVRSSGCHKEIITPRTDHLASPCTSKDKRLSNWVLKPYMFCQLINFLGSLRSSPTYELGPLQSLGLISEIS